MYKRKKEEKKKVKVFVINMKIKILKKQTYLLKFY